MNKKNIATKLVLAGLTMLSLVGAVQIFPPASSAQSSVELTPPGCYFRRSATDYGLRGCPSDDFRNAIDSRGVCFVTRSSSSSVYFEVDCDGLTLTGSHNEQRARRVCDALEGEHYWNTQNGNCYHGENCQIDPGTNGIRTSGCTESSVAEIYGSYMRGELISPSSTSDPAGSGGGGGGGGSGGGGGGGSGSGDTTFTPSDEITPEQQCINDNREWVPSETDPTTGTCQVYRMKTTNDCQGENIQAGVSIESGNHCGILDYFVIIINVLSGIAGIIIVGAIVAAGMQYSSAGSDPQKVSAAKNRIKGAIIALLLLLFGFSILNFFVPGGVL